MLKRGAHAVPRPSPGCRAERETALLRGGNTDIPSLSPEGLCPDPRGGSSETSLPVPSVDSPWTRPPVDHRAPKERTVDVLCDCVSGEQEGSCHGGGRATSSQCRCSEVACAEPSARGPSSSTSYGLQRRCEGPHRVMRLKVEGAYRVLRGASHCRCR